MKNKDLEVLWVEIESDLEDVEVIIKEVKNLRNDIQSSGERPSQRDKAALGSFLHSFYNGVENILRRISREVDGTLPQGEGWHRALLKRMGREVPNRRSSVLSEETTDKLKPYLGFRHFFRHSYAFEIDWGKLKPLVEDVGGVFKRLKQDLVNFFEGQDSGGLVSS